MRPAVAVAAVDWGGTWIRAGVVVDGQLVTRDRCPRPDGLAAQFDAVASLVGSTTAGAGATPAAVGVGIAGVVQGDAVATAINLGITSPTPVAAELRRRLGGVVTIVNDSQAVAGSLAGRWPHDLTAVITMGTGIGGAVVDRGRLLIGGGAAGDFGHAVVVADGAACACGGRGCLEMYVSGRHLATEAERLAVAGLSPLLESRWRAAGRVDGRDLQDAAADEPAARVVLRQAAAYLAVGIRNVVAHVDPTRVALAGLALSPDVPFGIALRAAWEAMRPTWCGVTLEHVVADSEAVLLGAASLALAAHGPEPR